MSSQKTGSPWHGLQGKQYTFLYPLTSVESTASIISCLDKTGRKGNCALVIKYASITEQIA